MHPIAPLAVFLVICASAGARELQQAEAPTASRPVADLLFTISADKALFKDATHLTLDGTSSTAQYYGKGARAGVIQSSTFFNASAGAPYVAPNGTWLDNPTATLFGFDSTGMQHAVILAIASPVANTLTKTVTFNSAPIDASFTKTTKGVANEAAQVDGLLLTNVQAGTELHDVALFIDHNRESMIPVGKPEFGSVGGFNGAAYAHGGGGGGTVQPFNGAAYANGGGGGGGGGGQQQWGGNRASSGDWGDKGGDWHHHP